VCVGNTKCGRQLRRERAKYRLYMSETMSISASACAIFCSEEIWGLAPMPKKDMVDVGGFELAGC
jgi:hypothetical protein